MTDRLTPQAVTEIKQRLWAGETQDAVARQFNMSVSLIGNIFAGHRWAKVVWPNGRGGALAKSRKTQIEKARVSARKKLAEMVREDLEA